jgi:hypothetical protein
MLLDLRWRILARAPAARTGASDVVKMKPGAQHLRKSTNVADPAM